MLPSIMCYPANAALLPRDVQALQYWNIMRKAFNLRDRFARLQVSWNKITTQEMNHYRWPKWNLEPFINTVYSADDCSRGFLAS